MLLRMKVLATTSRTEAPIVLINSSWTVYAGIKGSIALLRSSRKSVETGIEVAIWGQQEGPIASTCFLSTHWQIEITLQRQSTLEQGRCRLSSSSWKGTESWC